MAERNFTLTLPASMVEYVGNALAQRPYGEVVGVLATIQRQVTEQTTPHPVAQSMAKEIDRLDAMRAHAAAE